jgi:hypothetical protein
MKIKPLSDDSIPTFCWDRQWNSGEIRRRLRETEGFEKLRLIAWIMREGTFNEIWNFLKPSEVSPILKDILPLLGKKRDYWSYTFDVWRRLGKI